MPLDPHATHSPEGLREKLERIRDIDEQTSDGALGSIARYALDELDSLASPEPGVPRVPEGAAPCRHCGALPGEEHTTGCLHRLKPATQAEPEGEKHDCEYCNGRGWIEGIGDHHTPDGEYIGSETIQESCPACGGSGKSPAKSTEGVTVELSRVAALLISLGNSDERFTLNEVEDAFSRAALEETGQ